jgi:hypothetical protein
MMDLSELEHAVLTKLLAGEHPLLDLLRRQLAKCRVTQRELTGHGFFAHLDVGDVLPVADMKVILDDVVAEIEGMPEGAGFVLYVEHGRLSMLEGYGYDDPWPTTISTYTLRYRTGEERDWDGLRKVLR